MTDDASNPPDALVARAIESVLEAMPVAPEEEASADLAKYQPWADTAAPTGKNKRPLEALLDELRERVEAEPDALAAQPAGRRPALAYFDRFGGPRREGGGGGQPGRKRRRGRGGAAAPAPAPPAAEQRPRAPRQGGGPPDSGDAGRRRRRRRGGRGRSAGGPGQGGAG